MYLALFTLALTVLNNNFNVYVCCATSVDNLDATVDTVDVYLKTYLAMLKKTLMLILIMLSTHLVLFDFIVYNRRKATSYKSHDLVSQKRMNSLLKVWFLSSFLSGVISETFSLPLLPLVAHWWSKSTFGFLLCENCLGLKALYVLDLHFLKEIHSAGKELKQSWKIRMFEKRKYIVVQTTSMSRGCRYCIPGGS